MEGSIAKYQALCEVARLGSLTAAARELGYSQSGMSRIMQDLEREWGVTLLSRGRHGITLTPDGDRILPMVQRVVDDQRRVNELVGEVRGLETGSVRVGTFSSVATYRLPRVLGHLQAAHPKVEYELLMGDWGEIERWTNTGRVDVGFIPFAPAAPLQSRVVEKDELMAVVPREHPLAARAEVRLGELTADPYLMLERGDNGVIPRMFADAGLEPRVWLTTWDDYAIMSMVEAGLGVSVLPRLILQRCPFDVTILPLAGHPYREINVIWRDEATLSRAARDFLESLDTWG